MCNEQICAEGIGQRKTLADTMSHLYIERCLTFVLSMNTSNCSVCIMSTEIGAAHKEQLFSSVHTISSNTVERVG